MPKVSGRPTCRHAKDAYIYPYGPACVGDEPMSCWACDCAKTGKHISDAEMCNPPLDPRFAEFYRNCFEKKEN